MSRLVFKYLCFFVIVLLYLSCKRSSDALISSSNLYGLYDTQIYINEDILITTGTLYFFLDDSITAVTSEGFIDIIDTLGVAEFIPDQTYACRMKNDSLEFITASLPNFGVFLIKGFYSNNTIRGKWELWGHIALEQTGPLESIKKR